MFEVKQVFIEKPAAENPDWGFGRNCRVLLRTSKAEFSQSVFSVQLGEFMMPNRDYPYEGLCAISDGENWKFLDSLAFCLKRNGENLRLQQKSVKIFPWKSAYSYSISDGAGELHVEYYLFRQCKLPILDISFSLKNFKSEDMVLQFEPLVDIRHMYSASFPDEHSAQNFGGGICVQREGKQLFILSKTLATLNFSPRKQDWNYKLGNGSREYRHSALRFCPDSRTLFAPGVFDLTFNKSTASLQLFCVSDGKSKPSLELKNHDEKTFLAKLSRLQKPYAAQLKKLEHIGKFYRLALQGRLFNLVESFDLETPRLHGPDAGSMWFRNIWFRDVFQGIYDNFDIYFKEEKAYLKALISTALKLQKNGLIPNKLPESKEDAVDYSSADATLLCFLCSLEYLKRSDDRTISRQFKEAVKLYLQSLVSGNIRLENYLLKTSAHHSWTDSKYPAKFFNIESMIPARLPLSWAERVAVECKDYEEFAFKIYSPAYYLVEINALWIRFLKDFNYLYPSKEFEAMEANASINFKSFFFSDSPCSLMDEAFLKTTELSSTSIYSAALLPELFSDEELKLLLSKFEPLLVYRNRKLFGILTRNTHNRIYLNDFDYHSAVIWPRESVPLFKLLHRLQDPRTQEILESNLEHQMEEGAIFFNHELFALPEGPNPAPSQFSYSPVPVKNPAQFWSQWVQPYFDYLK
ncbi:MAG: amylo-alpha-1,6-glucosidase [Candidatus Micrarchaeota archaeon]